MKSEDDPTQMPLPLLPRPMADALEFLETLDREQASRGPASTDAAALVTRVADLEVIVARLVDRLNAVEASHRSLSG